MNRAELPSSHATDVPGGARYGVSTGEIFLNVHPSGDGLPDDVRLQFERLSAHWMWRFASVALVRLHLGNAGRIHASFVHALHDDVSGTEAGCLFSGVDERIVLRPSRPRRRPGSCR